MTRVLILLGDPSRGLGTLAEPECRRIIAALDLAARAAGCRSSGSPCRPGRTISMDQRHREHGLDRRRAAAHRRVHPGRRRDQRRGDRHQRGRPALLERRGHHAHAHPGHPGHDRPRARWCSPASRPSTSPAACRPRTTSASAATSGSWAPTARPSTGRRDLADACEILLRHYEHTYVAPGERFPRRAATDATRSTGTCGRSRMLTVHDSDFSDGRRRLLRRPQPGAQEAVRHPLGHARGRPTRTTARWSAGTRWRDAEKRGGVGRPPRRASRVPARSGVPPAAAARLRARRRADRLDLGHPLPAVLEEDRPRHQRAPAATGRWSCWPTSRDSTARPSRCATGSSSTAPRSAGRSPTSDGPIVFVRHLPLPRRRLRRVLQGAQRPLEVAASRAPTRR